LSIDVTLSWYEYFPVTKRAPFRWTFSRAWMSCLWQQPLHIRRKNKRLIAFHKAVNQNSPVEIPDYATQSTYSSDRREFVLTGPYFQLYMC
jgi:hypothetical protein